MSNLAVFVVGGEAAADGDEIDAWGGQADDKSDAGGRDSGHRRRCEHSFGCCRRGVRELSSGRSSLDAVASLDQWLLAGVDVLWWCVGELM